MMDDIKTRSHIQAHAEAVERGDMAAIIADFSDDLRPQVSQLAKALPQPVKTAEVQNVDVGDQESIATIRYSGDSSEVTIQSHWREIGDRPVIIHAQPID